MPIITYERTIKWRDQFIVTKWPLKIIYVQCSAVRKYKAYINRQGYTELLKVYHEAQILDDLLKIQIILVGTENCE